MDDQISLNIDFKQNHSDVKISILKKVLYKFFYSKTYTSKSGNPFNIGIIIGTLFNYDIEDVDLDNNISVTLIYTKIDERPFVMWLEKTNGKILYYGLRSRMNPKWKPIDKLNEADEETKEKILLDSIKEMFSLFFATEMKINWTSFAYMSLHQDNTSYKVIPYIYVYDGFDRYLFKPTTVHSIHKVSHHGDVLHFDVDLRFVKDFYIYYVGLDHYKPILIETLDYEIGDETPLYNYYRASEIYRTKWVAIENGTKLTRPMCKSQLERILKEIWMKIKKKPIMLTLNNQILKYHTSNIEMIEDVPFSFDNLIIGRIIQHTYTSKVLDSFFIKSVVSRRIEQNIDLRSRKISAIYVFNIIEKTLQPVLLCFRLCRSSFSSNPVYIWYKLESLDGNEWTRLEFDASPNDDHQIIDQKIRDLYMPGINLGILLPSFWFFVFSFGVILGALIGMNCSLRIIGSSMRLYRYIRP